MQHLNIKISNFEGPFDLLLHLIKKNEMDIYNIKIYDITNQYLQYIDGMKELDLEITSEFIVMAATLLEIKSKTLLPKEKKEDDEEDEEDLKKILMNKLIEYKKFKKAAEYLGIKKGDAGFIFSKKPEIIEDKKILTNEELLKNVTMLKIYNLYNELINRYNNKKNTSNVISREIPVDKYKIEDKMKEIKEKLYRTGSTKFSDIMMECECKIEIVVTFLAILELIKDRIIKVVQEGNFQKIYIEGVWEEDEN